MKRTRSVGDNASQIEYWNGPVGEKWARLVDDQELMLGHLGSAAMDAGDIQSGHSVLDVGCGSGITTFEIARRVGDTGHVLGIDISSPMLDVGRARLAELDIANVTFKTQDAASYPFEPRNFSRVFSRFGVMFFADPTSAFDNIRGGMAVDGRLTFVCWRKASRNQWMEVPLGVVLRYVPTPPAADPNAPGPTAFADPDRVRGILASAGFSNITVDALETEIPIGKDIPEAVQRLFDVGPTSRLLSNVTDGMREQIRDELGEAISACQSANGVTMESSTWIVSANAM